MGILGVCTGPPCNCSVGVNVIFLSLTSFSQQSYIKTDFSRWKDEDESGSENENPNDNNNSLNAVSNGHILIVAFCVCFPDESESKLWFVIHCLLY